MGILDSNGRKAPKIGNAATLTSMCPIDYYIYFYVH